MVTEPLNTKNRLTTKANAKHKYRLRTISAARVASRAGKTMDVTIITCWTNLTNADSGLNAHSTLAPANERYATRQMMWGARVTLPRREKFCAANRIEITAMAGQKTLFSSRASPAVCIACSSVGLKKANNGDTIKAKAQAATGTIVNLSITGAGALGRLAVDVNGGARPPSVAGFMRR